MPIRRLVPLVLCLAMPVAAAAQSGGKPTAPPAAAQPNTSTPDAASQQSRAEAKALGDLLHFPERAKATVAQMRDGAVRAAMNSGADSEEEAAKIVDDILLPDFNAQQSAIEDILYKNLAAHFSATELRKLRDFFGTPVGRRWVAELPKMEGDNLREIQVLGQKTFRDSVVRHADELHARGLKF